MTIAFLVLLGANVFAGIPTLSEVTSVPTPTNVTTPSYTFSTTEDGAITYSGDCTSATTAATSGSNIITFSTLADGIHDNCTIIVTSTSTTEASLPLAVTAFTVDAAAPVITIANANNTPAQTKTVTATTDEGTLKIAINNSGITTCDATLTFADYSDTTFSAEADNGKTICYKATDTAGNMAYLISAPIAGIDKTKPTFSSAKFISSTAIELAFNEDMSAGSKDKFTVTQGTGTLTVSDMQIQADKTKIRLTLSTADPKANAAISYTKAQGSGAALTDRAGNETDDFSNQTVSGDNTKPVTTSSFVSSEWQNTSGLSVTLACSDSGSGCNTTLYCIAQSDNCTPTTAYAGAIPHSSEGTYYLRFSSTDNAGNTEDAKSKIVKIDRTAPTPSPATVTCTSGSTEATVNWSAMSDSFSGLDRFVISWTGGSSGSNTITDLSATHAQVTGLNASTQYTFTFTAYDKVGLSSSGSATCTTTSGNNNNNNSNDLQDDSIVPIIVWASPDSNSSVSGIATLSVNARDFGTGINYVVFELPDKNYVTVKNPVSGGISNGNWQLEWPTWNLENKKEYAIKAMAKDKGNPINNSSAWVSRSFVVDNTAALADREKADAQSAIVKAQEKKADAEREIAELKVQGIELSSDSLSKKASADSMLSSAKTLLAQKNYSEAMQKADSAADSYEEISALDISSYGESQEYKFSSDKAVILLRAAGLSDSLAQESEGLMENIDAVRELVIKEVNDGDNSYYRAIVIITLTNNLETEKELKVIEIVPKEFAENADELVLGEETSVLEADPKLEFSVSLAAGETKAVSYSLKKNLTKAEADSLLDSSPMENFLAPPALLNGTSDTSALSGSGTAAGLFSLAALGGLTGWIALIVVVAIVLAVIALVVTRNRGGQETGFHPLGFEGGRLNNLRRQVSEPRQQKTGLGKPGKWGYNK